MSLGGSRLVLKLRSLTLHPINDSVHRGFGPALKTTLASNRAAVANGRSTPILLRVVDLEGGGVIILDAG